ncbi:hypothetical protein [Pseudorhizobium flavum]|uniref:Transposase n=1 Tax=Pseudorhizobium flavum TaxID=1335061 RepID=A0A7X0DGG5_9HYPH|nr:hypothetical protein [Pseudorhizobium flavum]MBB6182149.1 hypothetical protein [Pseudorhizobium flavum]CAD6631990.1 transposase [Pseudorhizobium flavum]
MLGFGHLRDFAKSCFGGSPFLRLAIVGFGQCLRDLVGVDPDASEKDLRGFVIKRKISGGTVSRNGRQARDSLLGLSKTCQKLGLSFWHYLGDRLGICTSQAAIPPLATMIVARS